MMSKTPWLSLFFILAVVSIVNINIVSKNKMG